MCGAANLVRFGLGAGTEQYLALGRGIEPFARISVDPLAQTSSICVAIGRTLRRDDEWRAFRRSCRT